MITIKIYDINAKREEGGRKKPGRARVFYNATLNRKMKKSNIIK